MKDKKLRTKFAPAERASIEEIKRQIAIFENNEVLNQFLSKIPAVFLIVNKYRQVVYMNKGALEFTGLDDLTSVLGQRAGEIIGCVHSTEEEGGCGTTESCTWCGAVRAVLSSQKGQAAVEDCRLILSPDENAFDLRVWAAPFVFEGEEFYAVTIQDIQHEKRRFALEQIFFHDLLNTIQGLLSTTEILVRYGNEINQKEFINKISYQVKHLIEEIQGQQVLHAAENNELIINPRSFITLDLLKEIVDLYVNHNISKEKQIKIDKNAESLEMSSDRIILGRIISNMVKNAIEATPTGGTITLGCEVVDNKIQFWVHNPGFIPRDIQLQIFQRSFSTKGPGRGLGTHSMKLLSSFLNGNVTFSTSEEKGTIFRAIFPIKMEYFP
ncbi:MAG: sensor histidine kinase [Promethearchaeota archaeon]